MLLQRNSISNFFDQALIGKREFNQNFLILGSDKKLKQVIT
jgi:hypothetical protein